MNRVTSEVGGIATDDRRDPTPPNSTMSAAIHQAAFFPAIGPTSPDRWQPPGISENTDSEREKTAARRCGW